MEDVLRAIVLGIIQGLTEFLPISSSGHLIIARELFGWEFADDLVFDVSLHLGTTVAVVGYFLPDWLRMARSGLLWLSGERSHHSMHYHDARLLLLIIVGSVPIAIFGFAFQDWIEDEVRSAATASAMLVIFAFVLYLADRRNGERTAAEDGRISDALIIGGAQALALIPGVSRSGITISAGLFRDFTRTSAARFSFLLSTPAIGGAALLTMSEAIADGVVQDNLDVILAGAISAGVVGWLSIAVLMRLIQTHSFFPFVVYRVIVGTAFFVYFAF
jgi:undecaprenyl-diphosphatase